jgi:hypothetical protein
MIRVLRPTDAAASRRPEKFRPPFSACPSIAAMRAAYHVVLSPRASTRTPSPERPMPEHPPAPLPPDEAVPLGQRLFDNPWLLLVAGIVVMVVLYTGWGLWEILSLTPAPLP